MIRNYYGDIDGTFWDGYQNGKVADRFGCFQEIIFYVISDISTCIKEMTRIEDRLGDKLDVLMALYNKYGDEMAHKASAIGVSKDLISEFADYIFGMNLKNRLELYGIVEFSAEQEGGGYDALDD